MMKKGVFMNNSTTCTNNLPSPATLSTHNRVSVHRHIGLLFGLVKLAIKKQKYSFGNRHTFRLFFNNLNLNIRPETRTLWLQSFCPMLREKHQLHHIKTVNTLSVPLHVSSFPKITSPTHYKEEYLLDLYQLSS